MLERDSFGNADGSACSRFGTTIAFDAATIASWYPDHRSYVAAVDRAARRAVARGVLIAVDAKAIRRAAMSSSIGRWWDMPRSFGQARGTETVAWRSVVLPLASVAE